MVQRQEKFAVNFSCHYLNNCHCLIDCLKKTIEQLIKQWYNGKKSSRELFLPLFNNCHCLIDCLKKTIEQLIKQWYNGKKSSRELFLPLFKKLPLFNRLLKKKQ